MHEDCDHETIMARYRKSDAVAPYDNHNTHEIIFHSYGAYYTTDSDMEINASDYVDSWCWCGEMFPFCNFIEMKEGMFIHIEPEEMLFEMTNDWWYND